MGNVPPEMQERLMAAIDKDPEFFSNLGKEIDTEVKNGKGQMAATMGVMKKHQARLRELMS